MNKDKVTIQINREFFDKLKVLAFNDKLWLDDTDPYFQELKGEHNGKILMAREIMANIVNSEKPAQKEIIIYA